MTKDAVEGAEAPIQNVAHRPRSGVRFMDAVNTVVVGVKYYADRGVPLGIGLLNKMNHTKAVNFFRRVAHKRKSSSSSDAKPKLDLPVLPSSTAVNSLKVQRWDEELSIKLGEVPSEDGVGTLKALVRENDDPKDWADVDVTDDLDTIADEICPFGGTVHRADQKKFHSAMVDACKHAGRSWVDDTKRTSNGRKAYKEVRGPVGAVSVASRKAGGRSTNRRIRT